MFIFSIAILIVAIRNKFLYAGQARYWEENKNALVKCQSYARTHLARKELLNRRALHEYSLPIIIALQSQCRGWLVRREWNQRLKELEKLERWIIKVKYI